MFSPLFLLGSTGVHPRSLEGENFSSFKSGTTKLIKTGGTVNRNDMAGQKKRRRIPKSKLIRNSEFFVVEHGHRF